MDGEQWLARLTELSAGVRPPGATFLDCAGRALVDLHDAFVTTSDVTQNVFANLADERIEALASARLQDLDAGSLAWPMPGQHASRAAAVLAAAAQLRALDRFLLTHGRGHHGPPEDPRQWLVPGTASYLIPRKHPHRQGGYDGQAFSRRGLLHHRILPVETRGHPVRLVRSGTIPGTRREARAPLVVGAALFADVDLRLEEVGHGFVASDVTCRDPAQAVARQVAGALESGCFAAVWPELTMPPPLLATVVELLKAKPARHVPRTSLQVVVAGSWHVPRGPDYANVVTVLDGYGMEVLSFDKRLAYFDRERGLPEAIRPGDDIPVLVTDDLLIGFGVCRDFCDLSVKLPYPELDVDLVLVPSMGGHGTMRGHQATAKQIRVLYDAKTFVVQQSESAHPIAGALGLVLPMLDDPLDCVAERLRQAEEWKVYHDNVPDHAP